MPRPHPSLRRHRPSGQAVVTLNNVDHYLGVWPESRRRPPPETQLAYDRLIAEWLANGRRLPEAGSPAALTINELILAFWKHAEVHYAQSDGQPSGELSEYRYALRALRELYGTTPAAEFGPLKLKAVRERMVASGLSRGVVNQRIGRVVRAFKWAVAEELVAETVHRALKAVPGLQKGRTKARETAPVKPVDLAHVEAVLPHVLPSVAAMIRLQVLTGMRPGEACIMRSCDIDTSGEVWVYRLARHKTAHHGHQRTVALGPKAQELLRPFLAGRDPTTYLFSPQEAVEHRLRLIRTRRQTKVQPSQVCRKKARPKHRPGERYNSRSYLWAIRRVIGRLNEAARLKDPSLPADHVSVPLWHPHQLRHTYASEVRRQFGLEAAQVALGHAKVNVTELYAERDLQLAARVARAVG